MARRSIPAVTKRSWKDRTDELEVATVSTLKEKYEGFGSTDWTFIYVETSDSMSKLCEVNGDVVRKLANI